jgi:hypothetical protein
LNRPARQPNTRHRRRWAAVVSATVRTPQLHPVCSKTACMTVPARSSERLRELLRGPDFLSMPCCFDALSARLVEDARFPLTFMSGFAVSAARLAAPDTGL